MLAQGMTNQTFYPAQGFARGKDFERFNNLYGHLVMAASLATKESFPPKSLICPFLALHAFAADLKFLANVYFFQF